MLGGRRPAHTLESAKAPSCFTMARPACKHAGGAAVEAIVELPVSLDEVVVAVGVAAAVSGAVNVAGNGAVNGAVDGGRVDVVFDIVLLSV